MTSTTSTTTPNDEELVAAIRPLRSEFPTLGITKFHAALLKDRPLWAVSEKRFRKVLQQHGLNAVRAAEPEQNLPEEEGKVYPTFRLSEQLDIGKFTSKVEVKYFGPRKGKGLVAKEKIEADEKVWKEDPWVLSPEWEVYETQQSSLACMHCSTPLSDSRLVVTCPASPCPGRFCNRLCLAKSAGDHPLLCRGQNPAAAPLLDLAKRGQWIGLHALARQTAKILLANEKGIEELDVAWGILRGFAEMGMEDRVKENGQTASARDRQAWKAGHKLYLQAFRLPLDTAHQKKLARLVKKTLPANMDSELFSYEGFLRGLGRMNLNLEAHGGLYPLHSHLNHSCTPNVSVRHIDQRSALARITIVALEDIQPGKELLVTYVDPEANVQERRTQLRQWGFGVCHCARCVKEAADLPAEKKQENGKSQEVGTGQENGAAPRVDQVDLERELRDGFGL